MNTFQLIQLRRQTIVADNDPNKVVKLGEPYFINIGKVESNDDISKVDFYHIANVACWNQDWKDEQPVTMGDTTYYPSKVATGVVNGDFYVTCDEHPDQIWVCLPIGEKMVTTKEEAEFMLLTERIESIFSYGDVVKESETQQTVEPEVEIESDSNPLHTTIEIDCAPEAPRPDTYFQTICETILHKEYWEPISKWFGNWTWEVTYESKDQQDKVEQYIRKLYNDGCIRYGSW